MICFMQGCFYSVYIVLAIGQLPIGFSTNNIMFVATVDHAMNCPTLLHNELREFTAAVLIKVCIVM